MNPIGSTQTTESYPQVQKHNAETKTAASKLVQQEHKRLTQS